MANDKRITLTHLNVRQSIAILITKLIVIDLLFAVVAIVFYYSLTQGDQFITNLSSNPSLFLFIFAIAGLLKIVMGCYTILLWLNEYYEITPDSVIHKKGIIFKQEQRYRLDYVRVMNVVDNFFGELFNFGSITLYDIRLNKFIDLYLIHNPRRYAKILHNLKPDLEIKEDHVWLPILEKKRESLEESDEE